MNENKNISKKIGVLGAGTWGMALSVHLTRMGHQVTVWSALPDEIDEFSKTRLHPNLPAMVIPNETGFTKDLEEACKGKDMILFAVPSIFIRGTARDAAPYIEDRTIIVSVAKGIETDTLMIMTDIIREELEKCNPSKMNKVVAFSGPTHAEEVSIGLPTAIVSASKDMDAAQYVQDSFMYHNFRVYTNPDELGVELCGAMKNVIALAVGVSTGLGYGDNAMAALITRGMEEIHRLGMAMGCDHRTFSGLAGIGDLIVTATSEHSRNNRCGKLIGEGVPPEEAVKKVGMVVEGLNALPAMIKLSKEYGVEAPVARMLDSIINNGVNPEDAAMELMTRERKSEI